MAIQSWCQTLITAQVAGANLTASTTATSILPAQAKFVLPANTLNIGQMLRLRAQCQLGNIVTTPGTLTIDVRHGATVVFNGGAMQLSSTAHTTLPFWIDIMLTARAVGSAANYMGQGIGISQCLSLTAVADSTTTPATLLMPNTVPTVGNNFDSTATQIVDLFATFSLNNANAIQLHQYSLELMN
jgi:hypothetical protein